MLRVYLDESDKWNGEPLYEAIVKRLRMMDVPEATVYRGILGYGSTGETHKEHFLHLGQNLPVMITIVDTPEKVDAVIPEIEGMMRGGLIATSDVDMIRLIPGDAPG